MYCYSLLKNDRVNIGHLEHSIEQKLDEEHLTECTPNIAIACPNCNLSLKRVGEQERLQIMIKYGGDYLMRDLVSVQSEEINVAIQGCLIGRNCHIYYMICSKSMKRRISVE